MDKIEQSEKSPIEHNANDEYIGKPILNKDGAFCDFTDLKLNLAEKYYKDYDANNNRRLAWVTSADDGVMYYLVDKDFDREPDFYPNPLGEKIAEQVLYAINPAEITPDAHEVNLYKLTWDITSTASIAEELYGDNLDEYVIDNLLTTEATDNVQKKLNEYGYRERYYDNDMPDELGTLWISGWSTPNNAEIEETAEIEFVSQKDKENEESNMKQTDEIGLNNQSQEEKNIMANNKNNEKKSATDMEQNQTYEKKSIIDMDTREVMQLHNNTMRAKAAEGNAVWQADLSDKFMFHAPVIATCPDGNIADIKFNFMQNMNAAIAWQSAHEQDFHNNIWITDEMAQLLVLGHQKGKHGIVITTLDKETK